MPLVSTPSSQPASVDINYASQRTRSYHCNCQSFGLKPTYHGCLQVCESMLVQEREGLVTHNFSTSRTVLSNRKIFEISKWKYLSEENVTLSIPCTAPSLTPLLSLQYECPNWEYVDISRSESRHPWFFSLCHDFPLSCCKQLLHMSPVWMLAWCTIHTLPHHLDFLPVLFKTPLKTCWLFSFLFFVFWNT